MSPQLDKQLCERYPKIFHNRNKNMYETCMCWGFQHDDGWYNIIEVLCANIQHHIDWKRKSEPFVGMTDEEFDETHQPVAAQVKEKFGSLRFYLNNTDEFVRGLVSMAEGMSSRTCESCGVPGSRRGVGWIQTLCDGCHVVNAEEKK